MQKLNKLQYDMWAFTTAGTLTAYTLALAGFSLVDEISLLIEFHTTCGDNATININSTWAKNLKNSSGSNVVTWDLKSTWRYQVTYDVTTDSYIVWTLVPSEIPGAGYTGIINGFNLPYNDDSYLAVETITLWQHCCRQIYDGIELTDRSATLQSMTWPATPIHYWQCFYLPIDSDVTTIESIMRGYSNYQVTAHATLVAKIYAITGTYWVDAVPTWSALYTSNTLTPTRYEQVLWFYYTAIFTFGSTIPAWYYCMMIEWTIYHTSRGWQSGVSLSILGDTTSVVYDWNTVDDTTPVPNVNMNFDLNTTPVDVVAVADASDISRSDRVWQATESKIANESIVLQDQWEIDQTWALNDRALRYLSDTPGEISTTPWTNLSIIAQGSGTDKAWMGRIQEDDTIDITNTDVHYTNTECILEANFFVTYSGTQYWASIEVQISDDNVTYVKLAKTDGFGQFTADNNPAIQCRIPAWKFFKVLYTYWTITWLTENYCRVRPIK